MKVSNLKPLYTLKPQPQTPASFSKPQKAPYTKPQNPLIISLTLTYTLYIQPVSLIK